MKHLKLGICYYPEHWDRSLWRQDLDAMAELGISYVRLAEFAWSKLQPSAQEYDFAWLDEVISLAQERQLKVVLGTPTATPPAWLIKQHPEILPVAADGRVREFGSRRHYSFNSPLYMEYSAGITQKLAQRYGAHPAVVAWQTDNEFACHNTARSYGAADLQAFQQFLAAKYQSITKLNKAWGNDFWAQNYGDFSEIPLPNHQVTETNPAHTLDFYRASSAAVVAFNRQQTELLRRYSQKPDLTHNMMGFFTEFDHHHLAADLDFASWDNYPLGYLSELPNEFEGAQELKLKYYDVGHPDLSAFNHDLYRCLGRGRFWVMEQQPGPVNWARHNPVPAKGAVKFWTWQAFAHGAEVVSYFRWRQVPYAQEQMHAGLLLPNSEPAQGYYEVQELTSELAKFPKLRQLPAEVALVYDYESLWYCEILPQGASFSALSWLFSWYEGLRAYGLNLDIVSAAADFSKYKLVLCPVLVNLSEELLQRLQANRDTHFVWGPRSGSKDENFAIPPQLPPGRLQELIPVQLRQVSSLAPEVRLTGSGDFGTWQGGLWREFLDTELKPRAQDQHGGIFYSQQNHSYLGVHLERASLAALLELLLAEAGVKHHKQLPEGVRISATTSGEFRFDFKQRTYQLPS